MAKIITITLNPAYDLHYTINSFKPYEENFVDRALIEPGGKGINITRALHMNGTKSTAFVVLGKGNCASFEKSIRTEGISFIPLYTAGKIRENITIHTNASPETRISLDDFSMSHKCLRKLSSMIRKRISKGDIVTFSGRVPRGLDKQSAIAFLLGIKEQGARLVIDSGSFGVDELLEIKPWLIKPNKQEIEALCGGEVESLEDALGAAEELVALGAENAIVSMGAKGAVYVGDGISITAEVPKITPLSTIGAGDSTIAGFISAFKEEQPLMECVRRAVSFGTAACLSDGTRPPLPKDIAAIMSGVNVTTSERVKTPSKSASEQFMPVC